MASPIPAPALDATPARDDSWVDEALAPFGVFVDAMSVATTASESGSEFMPSMWIERLEMELPFEMDVLVEPDGPVRLAGRVRERSTRRRRSCPCFTGSGCR